MSSRLMRDTLTTLVVICDTHGGGFFAFRFSIAGYVPTSSTFSPCDILPRAGIEIGIREDG